MLDEFVTKSLEQAIFFLNDNFVLYFRAQSQNEFAHTTNGVDKVVFLSIRNILLVLRV